MIAGNDRVGISVITAAGVTRIECALARAQRTGGVALNVLDLEKGGLIGTRGIDLTEISHLGGHGRLDHDNTGIDTTVAIEYSGLAS